MIKRKIFDKKVQVDLRTLGGNYFKKALKKSKELDELFTRVLELKAILNEPELIKDYMTVVKRSEAELTGFDKPALYFIYDKSKTLVNQVLDLINRDVWMAVRLGTYYARILIKASNRAYDLELFDLAYYFYELADSVHTFRENPAIEFAKRGLNSMPVIKLFLAETGKVDDRLPELWEEVIKFAEIYNDIGEMVLKRWMELNSKNIDSWEYALRLAQSIDNIFLIDEIESKISELKDSGN
ncbi:MAG: hypothetical protein ACTSRP_12570 [Candidatus Helarchaeota archaeon]